MDIVRHQPLPLTIAIGNALKGHRCREKAARPVEINTTVLPRDRLRKSRSSHPLHCRDLKRQEEKRDQPDDPANADG